MQLKNKDVTLVKYEYLLWDLDGTLTDSGRGIINAVKYALKQYGIEENDMATLRSFIGPPLVASFSSIYGFDKEKALEAVAHYRTYYSAGGLFENDVYPGIAELLEELQKSGYKNIMATSKPEKFSFQIMEHFGLDKYFYLMAGATETQERIEKEEVIEYALKKAGIVDRSQCIMIGDRKFDIFGAKINGLKSVGVLYGYGSREELEKAGADYIVETVGELRRFLFE